MASRHRSVDSVDCGRLIRGVNGCLGAFLLCKAAALDTSSDWINVLADQDVDGHGLLSDACQLDLPRGSNTTVLPA